MRRVLCHVGSFPVYSYPAMLSLGMCLGIGAGNVAARSSGLDATRVYLATLCLLVPALIGSRLLYVASHWDRYRTHPAHMWRRSDGGAMMYGGLLLVLPLGWPVLRVLELPVGAFADVATFTILVGMIVTRGGCLLNGCCAGRETDGMIGMWLPDVAGVWKRRVPTQLLEMGWATVLLATAVTLWKRVPFPGALFLYLVVGYAVGRMAFEMTREPDDRSERHVALGISLLLVLVGLATLVLGVGPGSTASGGHPHG